MKTCLLFGALIGLCAVAVLWITDLDWMLVVNPLLAVWLAFCAGYVCGQEEA